MAYVPNNKSPTVKGYAVDAEMHIGAAKRHVRKALQAEDTLAAVEAALLKPLGSPDPVAYVQAIKEALTLINELQSRERQLIGSLLDELERAQTAVYEISEICRLNAVREPYKKRSKNGNGRS